MVGITMVGSVRNTMVGEKKCYPYPLSGLPIFAVAYITYRDTFTAGWSQRDLKPKKLESCYFISLPPAHTVDDDHKHPPVRVPGESCLILRTK